MSNVTMETVGTCQLASGRNFEGFEDKSLEDLLLLRRFCDQSNFQKKNGSSRLNQDVMSGVEGLALEGPMRDRITL